VQVQVQVHKAIGDEDEDEDEAQYQHKQSQLQLPWCFFVEEFEVTLQRQSPFNKRDFVCHAARYPRCLMYMYTMLATMVLNYNFCSIFSKVSSIVPRRELLAVIELQIGKPQISENHSSTSS
jgi:hypothetical protein